MKGGGGDGLATNSIILPEENVTRLMMLLLLRERERERERCVCR